jgi:hypothetical protein
MFYKYFVSLNIFLNLNVGKKCFTAKVFVFGFGNILFVSLNSTF